MEVDGVSDLRLKYIKLSLPAGMNIYDNPYWEIDALKTTDNKFNLRTSCYVEILIF